MYFLKSSTYLGASAGEGKQFQIMSQQLMMDFHECREKLMTLRQKIFKKESMFMYQYKVEDVVEDLVRKSSLLLEVETDLTQSCCTLVDYLRAAKEVTQKHPLKKINMSSLLGATNWPAVKNIQQELGAVMDMNWEEFLSELTNSILTRWIDMCQNRTEWKITYGGSPNWPLIWKNSTKTSGDPGKAQYPMIRGLKMKEMVSKNWKPKSAARAEAARKKKMLSDLMILKSRINTITWMWLSETKNHLRKRSNMKSYEDSPWSSSLSLSTVSRARKAAFNHAAPGWVEGNNMEKWHAEIVNPAAGEQSG